LTKKFLIGGLFIIMLASYAWGVAEAPDPTRITCGARLLGMGRAFAGLSDDVNALFINPAGIAQLNRWQLTSMSGKLLDYNYMTFSGVYPTNFGNVGLGFSGSNIGGAYASKIVDGTQNTADPIYEFDMSLTPMSYFNNVFMLAYGQNMGTMLAMPQFKTLSGPLGFTKGFNIGATLKIFSSGLDGGGITNGSGTGQELDLGLMTKVRPWMNLGLSLKNVLPFSMGGKLRYNSGHEESYPVNVRLGTAVNLLGKNDAIREFGQNLKLLLDLETYPTRQRYPLVAHAGVEWQPATLITLRVGIDQDAAEDVNGNVATVSNLTAGVGLTYQQFRFDYGYHQFAGITGEDNHFFSLTFGLPVEEIKRDYITVTAPKDKTVTMEAATLVAGQSNDSKVKYVYANQYWLPLGKKNEFAKLVDLKLAKNRITVEAQDIQKKSLEKEYFRLCRLRTFPDVDAKHWANLQIGYIATLGIIEGYPTGSFKPEGNITRAELTAVLMRTKKVTGEATMSLFDDVKLSHWAAKFIMPAVKMGVVKGYPDGTFKPSANISRAEGLAMVARFSNITLEAGATPYLDVTASHWAAPVVKGSYRAGMLQFLGAKPFEPNRKLTRDEAVEMLFRSPYVQDMIKKDLLNWETY